MNRTKNETVPRQFRLKAETLAELDAIAASLSETTGVEHSRSDAIRFAARQTAKKISKKSSKSA